MSSTTESSPSAGSRWDPAHYQDKYSFVWRYGANLLELLDPRPGERILDVGCGTGQLTAEIARAGAHVTGLDNSPDMLAEARKNYPDLKFVQADAAAFEISESFDAVFSNAALHWVKNADGAAASIARALRPGGRFVAEFGGKGNIRSVLAALRAVLGPTADDLSPWRYLSVAEYSTILERHGLEVRNASLFDRPTSLDGGENGLEHWLRMFCQSYLRAHSPERTSQIIHQLAELLRPALFQAGIWTVDYRRLRVVAIRTS